MNKLLLFVLLLTAGLSFGQETETTEKKEIVTTSIEEYNYLTLGYAGDLEKGKNIKEGYELKEVYKFNPDKV